MIVEEPCFLTSTVMPAKQFPFLIRRLHRYVGRPASGVLDAELLERFVKQRDEAAFELHATLPHTVRFLAAAQTLLRHPVEGLRLRQVGGGAGAGRR